MLLFPVGKKPSCHQAAKALEGAGVALCDHVSPEITHLLLDIPSQEDIRPLLTMLPENITILGGNLDHLEGYRRIDLLKDEHYLAHNAAITADCALNLARNRMDTTWAGTRVLILGWGRIGKCLAKLLSALGAEVTVSARRAESRAMIEALGFRAVAGFTPAEVVFNTVPELIWPDCLVPLKIDLASRPGLGGEDVIWACGLPGIHAAKTTGQLIARRILEIEEEAI